jgi:transposase
MLIVGADYHPGFQQIAFVDMETGELQERRLAHREEAEKFYRELAASGVQVRVGMEASGHARWFERLLAELNFDYGWGMRPRSVPSEYASRGRIVRMPSTC